MCGIAGFWALGPPARGIGAIGAQAQRMAQALSHRGPDDAGVWTDADAGLALAHRRLSINDLSAAGHQPMHSADGRYSTVFNGEIYNFKTLRDELSRAGRAFSGHSDTEVLLAAISHWGLDRTLPRLHGMFAFALWDAHAARLHLVRDRLGKKPLYYGWSGNAFVFASELKAFSAIDGFDREVDRAAVALYLRLGYVPAPWCIYRGLFKLGAGTTLGCGRAQARARFDPADHCHVFWSAAAAAARGVADPLESDADTATDALAGLLADATAQRMVADVPVGSFLSGGIDSSLVTATMAAQSTRPIQTFSLGFGTPERDETGHARAIANYLGTEHHQIDVSPRDILDVVPRLPDIVDEPLADVAQVPNYLIAALARSAVTVALSGDGGDELFCGYRNQTATAARWRKLRGVPRFARYLVGRALCNWPGTDGQRGKYQKHGARLRAASLDALFFDERSQWRYPERVLAGPAVEPAIAFADSGKWPAIDDPLQRTLLLDQTYFLTEDILLKVDRTSMASGLEVRSPLLDHRIVEWSWRLPVAMKYRDGRRKWILRRLLGRLLPQSLFERPKRGFGAPIGDWLAGPLRGWAQDLLAADRLARQGLFDVEPVRRLWALQDCRDRRWQRQAWTLLMLQAWLEHSGASIPGSVN